MRKATPLALKDGLREVKLSCMPTKCIAQISAISIANPTK